MNDDELVLVVTPVRMAVSSRRLTVSRPTSVSHRGLSNEGSSHVHLRLGDELPELGDLSNLLEQPGKDNREEGKKGGEVSEVKVATKEGSLKM